MSARLLRSAVAVAVCALLAGCVRMPTDGPVQEAQVSTEAEDPPGIAFDPRPPQDGDSAEEVVAGFLEAMKATPIKTTVARQFLSGSAADSWSPEQQILTYTELGSVSGESSVQVPLKAVNLYDARGAWQGARKGGTLDLGLVQEGGEWRIDEVPDALIVPDSWFDDYYQRVSLYYFDPTSEVLVPEPVFVPRGDQFASSLVRGLLAPLTDEAQDVVRTYFAPVDTSGLSVPVRSGIATVALPGDPDAVDEDTAQRMLAQLVWTLKQDDDVNAVELTIGGRLISYQGGSTQVNLGVGADYDPNGIRSDNDLFALDQGRVVTGGIGAFDETLGPLGKDAVGIRSVGANIDGSRIAAVSSDGTRLLLAPTDAADADVTEAVRGAIDLAQPHWDYRDRVWVLDRNGGAARVIVVEDGAARLITVPGLSGGTVTRMLVSRDGSRLVAVLRGAERDRVVSTRIRHDAAGGILGFTRLRTLPLLDEVTTRVRDIGWRSPTSVSVLSVIDDYSEVRTISVDGAPGEISTGGATRLRGQSRLLVATPVGGTNETFALAGRAVYSLTRPEREVPDLPRGLTSLTYVG